MVFVISIKLYSIYAYLIFFHLQETTNDGMARVQSKFQNLNTKVNKNVDARQTVNIIF